jgi:DNA polymerase-3 subunit delta'
MRHILAPDFDVLAAAEGLRDVHPADVIAWLQKWSYDLVHYAVRRVVRYNPDYADGAARVASRVDRLDVIRFHREMVRLQRDANHPLNPRLFMESVLFAYRDLLQPPVLAAA